MNSTSSRIDCNHFLLTDEDDASSSDCEFSEEVESESEYSGADSDEETPKVRLGDDNLTDLISWKTDELIFVSEKSRNFVEKTTGKGKWPWEISGKDGVEDRPIFEPNEW